MTKFINAHMGWHSNNLAKLDSLMDIFPNMYTEIRAVIAELGHQHRNVHQQLLAIKPRITAPPARAPDRPRNERRVGWSSSRGKIRR